MISNLPKSILFVTFFIAVLFFALQSTRVAVSPTGNSSDESAQKETSSDVEVVAENLVVPWDIVFPEKDEMLITEREGKIARVNLETGETGRISVFGVKSVSEGGLLGMTLHPDFKSNHFL